MTTTGTARPLRRNAHRQIAAIKASHTEVRVYTLENDFSGEKAADAEGAFEMLASRPRASAQIRPDGSVQIYLHSNRWYILTKPGKETVR